MINFQRPAFPALNNFCNKHLYTKLLSQFTAVHVNFILVGLLSSFGHMLTFIHYINRRYIFRLCFWIVFVVGRISLNQGSLY